MKSVDKFIHINRLFDCYGMLLTPRQQEIMNLYYKEDYSLGEIADIYSISRQAVHDAIKRGEESLQSYEDKIHHLKLQDAILNLTDSLISHNLTIEQHHMIEQIKNL